MKVNLGVELSDEQRRSLASIIAGKAVKRLASRDDVRDYLTGIVSGIAMPTNGPVVLSSPVSVAGEAGIATGRQSRGAYSPIEQAEVNRLVADGKTPEYARGWIAAGRVLAKSGPRSRFMRENA